MGKSYIKTLIFIFNHHFLPCQPGIMMLFTVDLVAADKRFSLRIPKYKMFSHSFVFIPHVLF